VGCSHFVVTPRAPDVVRGRLLQSALEIKSNDNCNSMAYLFSMLQLLYMRYQYITDLPVNLWLWVLLVAAPVIIFAVKPENSKLLSLRLIVASALSYLLINMTFAEEYDSAWESYNQCYDSKTEFRIDSKERNDACEHHFDHLSDLDRVSAYLWGYYFAIGYVGFWELLWRIRYRKRTAQTPNTFKWRWLSTLTILMLIPLMYFLATY
jgi:hypothetical protein